MALYTPGFLRTLYEKIPDSKKKWAALPYSYYLKSIIRARTWWKYDRKNSAPINPFKVLWIDPDKIEHSISKKELKKRGLKPLIPEVIGGDWDKGEKRMIKESTRLESMKKRFLEGVKWEETEHYQKYLGRLNKEGETDYGGYVGSKEELDQIFYNIDTLFRRIKEEGYKSQREVERKEEIVNAKVRPDHFIPSLNEVKVCIGREGDYLFYDNRHRLYIAKLLGIDKIPVTVRVRHKKWQEKRNLAVENLSELTEEEKQHPDIKYLIKK